jgi:hypothetical protein
MKTIPLTNNKVALIDDTDYEQLSKFNWCAGLGHGNWRAIRACRCLFGGKRRTIYMTRQIMSAPQGRNVDHRNHDTLDNQRNNLRVCSHADNQRNQIVRTANKTSKYKGVSWDKARNKWKAYVNVNGRLINLGRFHSEIWAAAKYDEAAQKYHGEFALLNFGNAIKSG